MSPSLVSSALALVWAGPAIFVTASAVLVILVLIGVYSWVILPLVDWIVGADTGRQQSFLKRIALWPVRKAAGMVEQFMREQIAAWSRWVASSATPLTLLMLQIAEVVRRIAGTLGDNAEATWAALYKLNHETIPRKITAALVPIRAQLQRHTGRLDDLEDLNRRVAVEVGDALRDLPWGVPGGYVTNIAAFLRTYVQLWEHYWNTTRTQLNTLLQDTIPELRRDIADLARRLDVQIDARFDALGNRITDLERWRENVVMPRLAALTTAVDALSDEVFGPVGGGLVALLVRIEEIERQLREDVAERFAALEAGLAQLRTDLEEGIRTGLGAFEQRVIALEQTLANVVLPRLDALQLAIDAIAAEVFTEVGAGLTALTARIVALEDWVFGQLGPKIDLALGRLTDLETQLRTDVLPRLRAIEDILAPAAFGAFVLAALKVSAPYLFCRNVIRGAEEVCAAPLDYIDDILFAAFAILAGLSIVELARELQGITGFVERSIDTFIDEDAETMPEKSPLYASGVPAIPH